MSNTLYNRTSWTTQLALSSDHLPIITTINIGHDYRLQQNVPRRHSLHNVGMLPTSAQIVSTHSLPPEMGARFRFWASRPSLPAAWLALLLTKAGNVESNPGPTTHTNKHTPVIWIFDLCHKQINKQQTSIRCKHTHNKHWVYLKCTQLKQRQYKRDRKCTIYTPTQNVTTTPITDNTTTYQKQTTTHPLTNKNQPKDKNSSYFKST